MSWTNWKGYLSGRAIASRYSYKLKLLIQHVTFQYTHIIGPTTEWISLNLTAFCESLEMSPRSLLKIHPLNPYNLIPNPPSWFLQHQSGSQVAEHASFEHISDERDIFRASAIHRHALLHTAREWTILKIAQLLRRQSSVKSRQCIRIFVFVWRTSVKRKLMMFKRRTLPIHLSIPSALKALAVCSLSA